jgi:tetratricopeptide (TPR) repeat protein
MTKSRHGPAWLIPAIGVFLALLVAAGLWKASRSGRSRSNAALTVAVPDAPTAEETALTSAAGRGAPGDPAPARALGDYHLGQGRPFTALWEYARARHARADDSRTTLSLARALHAALLHDEAVAHLRTLLHREPQNGGAAELLAEVYLQTGRPREALQAIAPPSGGRRAETRDGALQILDARALQALGDVAGARTHYIAAAEQAATRAEATHRLGLLELFFAGRRAEALSALARAASEAPEESQYAIDLARVQAASGRPEDRKAALAILRRVLETRPHGQAFLVAGQLLAAEGRLPQAAGAFARATAADPGLWQGYWELARALDRMGRRVEAHYQRALAFSVRDLRVRALEEYRRMAAADPSRPDGLLLASQSHFKMQQNARGADLARQAYERFPDSPEAREQLAALLIVVNDRQGATSLCEAWLQAEPGAAVPLRMLGRLAASDLRFTEAIRYYEQAIERDPKNADFRLALGEVLLDAPEGDRLPRATEALTSAAALAPESARARHYLGLALMRAGRVEEARRQLLRALDLDPHHGPTYSAVVQAARRLRQPGPVALFAPIARAVEDRLREELSLWRRTWDHPEDPDGYRAVASFLVHTGQIAKAEAQLEEALRRRPGWPEARADLERVRRLLAVL